MLGNLPAAILLMGLLVALAIGCNATPQPGLGSFRISAVAFSPIDAREVIVVFDEAVQTAGQGNKPLFLLDGHKAAIKVWRNAKLPQVFRVRFFQKDGPSEGTTHHVEVVIPPAAGSRGESRTIRSNSFQAISMKSLADEIVSSQLPDGAIPVGAKPGGWKPGDQVSIIPYFSHFAAKGLVTAYQRCRDLRYRNAARKWLEWYMERMDANGVVTDYAGVFPAYTSTGSMDSTDAYAARFVEAFQRYLEATKDLRYARERYPWVHKAVAAINLTMNPDGLTWAKPDYRVKYLMDNTEVVLGYRAAAEIAAMLGEADDARVWREQAQKTLWAIEKKLYLKEKGLYAISVADRAWFRTTWFRWDTYYPEGMAQCFAIIYLLRSNPDRATQIWGKFRDRFLRSSLARENLHDVFMLHASMLMEPDPYFLVAWARFVKSKEHRPYTYALGYVVEVLDELAKRGVRGDGTSAPPT